MVTQVYFLQTIMTISELRYPVYLSATDRLLNQEHIVGLINSVKWDIKEIMSQHNNRRSHIKCKSDNDV